MEPGTAKIVYSEDRALYSVIKVKTWWTAETWGEKSREMHNRSFLCYAVGEPQDIKDYYEVCTPGSDIEIEVKKVTQVDLNQEYNAKVISTELGREARDVKDIKKKLQEMERKLNHE